MKARPMIDSGEMYKTWSIPCEGGMKEGKNEFMAQVHDQMIVFNNVLRYRITCDAEKHGFPMIPLKNDKVIQEVQIGKIGVRPLVAGEIELPA